MYIEKNAISFFNRYRDQKIKYIDLTNTTTFFVVVNKIPREPFSTRRGIRQPGSISHKFLSFVQSILVHIVTLWQIF